MEPVTGIPVDTTNLIDKVNDLLKKLILLRPHIGETIHIFYDEQGNLNIDYQQ